MTRVLLAMALAACASKASWPKAQHDLGNSGRNAEAKAGKGEIRERDLGAGIYAQPLIGADGSVYAGTIAGKLVALDAQLAKERWAKELGQIITQTGLLDDEGNYYVGGGNTLHAFDAQSGKAIWSFEAESPETTKAFLDWFEGGLTLFEDGTLLAPNDNFRVYGVARKDGREKFSIETPDQTWSAPAQDEDGNAYFGNNNLLSILGANVFAIDSKGKERFSTFVNGSVVAPILVAGGELWMFGFDRHARVATKDGDIVFDDVLPDHVFGAAAKFSTGRIAVASADGTIVAYDADHTRAWEHKVGGPVRAGLAIDGEDALYVGGGDGVLTVLSVNGAVLERVQLQTGERDDLNAGVALGADVAVVGGEGGRLFSVPIGYCRAHAADARCLPVAAAAQIVRMSPLGHALSDEPIGVNEVLAFDGDVSGEVMLEPPVAFSVTRASDGHTLFITGESAWPEAVTVHVGAASFALTREAGTTLSGAVELQRVSLPLPTLLASYNQSGVETLRFSLTPSGNDVIMAGASDAAKDVKFTLKRSERGGSTLLENTGTVRLTLLGTPIAFDRFSISFTSHGAVLYGSTICGSIPFYGSFLRNLGLCSASEDRMTVFGGAEIH